MAWIESHQNLADHPKTRKLARILNISKPTTIGHLHCFWWWALDYADDGDISRFDSLDIAIGAEWDGDPEEFLQALIRSGFVDDDDGLSIHDWWDYAGKLIERRRANAKRMRDARARQNDAEIDSGAARAENVQRTQRARVEPPTNQPTEPDQKEPFGGADAPKPKQKRATQVPQDFAVTDKLLEWAGKNGFTREHMESQVPRFVDHYTAKGEPRKDWYASFQNWMRNARDYGHLNQGATMRRIDGGRADEVPTERPDLFGAERLEYFRRKHEEEQEARRASS